MKATFILSRGVFTIAFLCLSHKAIAAAEPPPDFTPIQGILNLECLNCHTHDGNSISPVFPRLAGQKAAYIETELKAFRSQLRTEPDAAGYMYGPASALNDDQIQLLGEYFSEQAVTPNEPGDTDKAKLGEQIFKNGIPSQGVPPCYACHGANGEGSDMAPRLAGQWSGYVMRQLDAFKNGERKEATIMPMYARNLTRDQAEDVANYVQGLR